MGGEEEESINDVFVVLCIKVNFRVVREKQSEKNEESLPRRKWQGKSELSMPVARPRIITVAIAPIAGKATAAR